MKQNKSWGWNKGGQYLKRIKTGFKGLKLNIKFMLLIILFIETTVGIFSGILFYYMEKDTVQKKISEMEYEMDRQYGQIRKNVDSINMSTQFFLNDQELHAFLVDVKQGKAITREALNTFYHKNIAMMERMINSNPYLYQIRVYVDDENLQEMMPVLYRQERMERLAWFGDGETAGWKFDYADTIFDSYALTQNDKIMSLVTPIADYDNGALGVLEVSVFMETMFEALYDENSDMAGCFFDEDGGIHYGLKDGWDNARMQRALDRIGETDADALYYDTVEGAGLIVGSLEIRELSGRLVFIRDISKEVGRIRNIRNWFVFIMILLIPFLAAVVNAVVKAVLGQFYQILAAIQEVQEGNLDVVVENCGTDEMGELGNQLNKMLAEIQRLMEVNLNRELLVKNSQIKALQNQINAHFIYNVLETIKMMAEIAEEYEISDAVTALGRLLRYSMRWKTPNVTVREEIEYIKNYLKLINLRFDYEIYLSLNIPDAVYEQQIPKMSLQPIVENAIYHGIEQMAEDTNIYIKGIVAGERCLIEVTDAGKGMSEDEVRQLYKKISGEPSSGEGKGNGIGLKNVQDRLQMSFGAAYGLEIASRKGCYTKVTIQVPFQETGKQEETAGHEYAANRGR